MDLFRYSIHDKDVLVYRCVFAPVNSNMFFIICDGTACVFDPCVNEEALELLWKNRISKVQILLTHEHFDHTSGVNWLKQRFNTEVYCQKKCANAVAVSRMNNPSMVAFKLAEKDKKDGGNSYQLFKSQFKPYTIAVDHTFDKEDTFTIGGINIHAVSTPGHCPGAACYEIEFRGDKTNNATAGPDFLFSGDTLLQYEPTITRFPESDRKDYENVSLPYLRGLPQNTIIMPGHGNPFVLKDTNNI